MDAEGTKLGCRRIANKPVTLLNAVTEFATDPEVVVEATYGWYWAVDLLRENGLSVHLAHPAGNDWGKRRVKNDERDARDLADLYRLGRLAEAWIAPPEVRQLRCRCAGRCSGPPATPSSTPWLWARCTRPGRVPVRCRRALRPGGGHARAPHPPAPARRPWL